MCECTLFVKADREGKKLGACPQSQRVLMLAELKVETGQIAKLKTVPVNVSRPPESFSKLGLRRVPALYIDNDQDPVDVADDIVAVLEQTQWEDPIAAELVSRDFFSRFCFYVRDVSKDSSNLEHELVKLDKYLGENGDRYLCGSVPGPLDCEVLPKLHQVRVACGIKGYQIPASLAHLWRYLHAAYSLPAFTKTCPIDREILTHWMEHIGETPANIRKFLTSLENLPPNSFSVPVFAKPVILE